MMDNLRTASNHIVLKIILVIIILSFVLTGVGGYIMGGHSNEVAKVNGEKISPAELERAYANERDQQQKMLGEHFSQLASNEAYMQQIRRTALSQLIDDRLITQYVKRLKLLSNDDQIKESIFKQPNFQVDGKFDNARYLAVIGSMGLTADEYAEALRTRLPIRQLLTALSESNFTLPAENDRLLALLLEQRIAREAKINVASLAEKEQISDETVKDYYDKNNAAFMQTPQVRVSYIKLNVGDLHENPSEADVQTWYDAHKADYTLPTRYRYSVIQSKTEKEAQTLLNALQNGADFATLAKEKSADPITASKDGDLGWMAPNSMSELQTETLTQKGQLSPVLTSPLGFFIVRLSDIQPEKIRPLNEVQDAIAEKVKKEKSLDAYYQLQQKIADLASRNSESLASIGQATGLKIKETSWFSSENIPEELNSLPVKQAIFTDPVGDKKSAPNPPHNTSGVITLDDESAIILQVTERKPEMLQPFDQVKAQIAKKLKYDKAHKEAREQAEKIISDLKAGKQDALGHSGLQFGDEITFERQGGDKISSDLFELPPPRDNKANYGISEDTEGNVVLLSFERTAIASPPKEQKEMLIRNLKQNETQFMFEALLNELREEAKIRYSAEFQPE